MRSPEWTGGGLNFRSNEIIVVSPIGSIPPFGTKVSRPADHEVEGIGGKHFAGGSLGVIVSSATAISTTSFLVPRIVAMGKIAI